MRTNQKQAGVMLIEALIGILIFSIGILALLGMQGTAIKNTTQARYRSEASYLATQIVGQMWVDDNDQLARYNTANAAAYAPRDNWVNNVVATLPGVKVGGPLAPNITVGPDIATGLAGPGGRAAGPLVPPGAGHARQLVILNRIHTGSGV